MHVWSHSTKVIQYSISILQSQTINTVVIHVGCMGATVISVWEFKAGRERVLLPAPTFTRLVRCLSNTSSTSQPGCTRQFRCRTYGWAWLRWGGGWHANGAATLARVINIYAHTVTNTYTRSLSVVLLSYSRQSTGGKVPREVYPSLGLLKVMGGVTDTALFDWHVVHP